MVRKRKKKPFYEVIASTRAKSSYGRALEPLKPERAKKGQSAAADEITGTADNLNLWHKRPKMLRFNAGRIEMSLSYQLVIALLLAAVLVVLVFFRLGQMTALSRQKKADLSVRPPEKTPGQLTQPRIDVRQKTGFKEDISQNVQLVESKGDNNIVIVQYPRRADLEPVKSFFGSMGIETEIIKDDNVYFLRTRQKYENPNRKGTNGYYALEKIKKAGAEYKAPQGYETFGTKPFQDAYGKRFDD